MDALQVGVAVGGVQAMRKRSMLAQVRSVRRVSQQLVMCVLLPNLRLCCFPGEERSDVRVEWARELWWKSARSFVWKYPWWNGFLLPTGFAMATVPATSTCDQSPII